MHAIWAGHAAGAAVALSLCLGLGSAASAAPAQLSFTGQVGNITGTPAGIWQNVQIGDTITVDYTFNDATADALPGDPTDGTYAQTISAFTLTIGAASDNALLFNGSIRVWNNHSVEDDQYNASAFLSGGASVLLNFEDATRTAFASDALPTSLNLADFAVRDFLLSLPGATVSGGIFVPEPAGLTLLGLGALALRRRR